MSEACSKWPIISNMRNRFMQIQWVGEWMYINAICPNKYCTTNKIWQILKQCVNNFNVEYCLTHFITFRRIQIEVFNVIVRFMALQCQEEYNYLYKWESRNIVVPALFKTKLQIFTINHFIVLHIFIIIFLIIS